MLHLIKNRKTVVFFAHPNTHDTLWLMRRPTSVGEYEIESGWMATKDVSSQLASYHEQGYSSSTEEVPRVILAILQRRQIEASSFPIFSSAVSQNSLSKH